MESGLYILIGIIGVVVSFILSELYVLKKNGFFLGLYLFVSVLFNSQHYSVAFNQEFLNSWLFMFSNDTSVALGYVRHIGLIFFILTLMTFPPSKFRLLLYVLFRRRNKSKY
ncbi:hypothetical protein C1S99_26530 [Vibrio parahaemolyticus]|jgi:uncharacterized membrane protein (DUF485 family)|nr:hypothetical protein C1T12_24735 [Vibrio parahaemolyticus]PMS58357.1 hypothetical protein C1S91_24665 [Vibrio parahaemolyticus]PMS65206.1 hypothetical protein C1S96_26190 [Vibrio parahaemolyticus]PMS70710.1 hypothetical protein C1T10_24465 [Vibrio parahaemolyticus]PMS74624.1 hypothetical protein C1S88_24525 [Vibrio parahaemolyticus]